MALVRRMEWVAYLSGSSPLLLTHWETRRAYCGVVRTGAPLEQALPKPSARSAQVVVERLARHLSQLEPDGSTGLALRPMLGGRARKASLPVRNRLSGPVLTTLFVTERRSWSVSGSARQR